MKVLAVRPDCFSGELEHFKSQLLCALTSCVLEDVNFLKIIAIRNIQHLNIILFCISLLLMNYIFLCVKRYISSFENGYLSAFLLESVFWALICMSSLLKTLILRLSFAVNLLLKFTSYFITTSQFSSVCLFQHLSQLSE